MRIAYKFLRSRGFSCSNKTSSPAGAPANLTLKGSGSTSYPVRGGACPMSVDSRSAGPDNILFCVLYLTEASAISGSNRIHIYWRNTQRTLLSPSYKKGTKLCMIVISFSCA